MGVDAMVILLVTIAVGTMVLGFWSDADRRAGDRRSKGLAAVHVLLAATSVTSLIVFLIGRAAVAGVVTLAALASAVCLGLLTLASSRSHERRASPGPHPVPVAMLAIHGGLALAAVVATAVAVSR